MENKYFRKRIIKALGHINHSATQEHDSEMIIQEFSKREMNEVVQRLQDYSRLKHRVELLQEELEFHKNQAEKQNHLMEILLTLLPS